MRYLIPLILLLGCTSPEVSLYTIKSDTIGQYKTNEAVVFCDIEKFSWPNFRDYVLTRFPEAEFGPVVKIEYIQNAIAVRNLTGDAIQFLETVPTVIKVVPIYLRDSKGNKLPPDKETTKWPQ